MKGDVLPGPTVSNNFLIEIDGLPPFYARKAGPFKKELTESDGADSTKHSGGRSNPGDFTLETPIHHEAEFAALNGWFRACEAGADGYKRSGTVHYLTTSGRVRLSVELIGLWIKGRELPEVDKTSDDQGYATWTVSHDDVEPV